MHASSSLNGVSIITWVMKIGGDARLVDCPCSCQLVEALVHQEHFAEWLVAA